VGKQRAAVLDPGTTVIPHCPMALKTVRCSRCDEPAVWNARVSCGCGEEQHPRCASHRGGRRGVGLQSQHMKDCPHCGGIRTVVTEIVSVPDWMKARVQQADTRPRCQIHTCRNLGRYTATTRCGCGEASIQVCKKHHTEIGAGEPGFRCFACWQTVTVTSRTDSAQHRA
jgi:hypothetical protein